MQTCVDDLLGLQAAPLVPKQTPDDRVVFDTLGEGSPLDAWADAFGVGPPKPTPAPPVAPVAPPPVALAPLLHPGTCRYPMVGGGFDCTRDGARIILPRIRWPLLPPPLESAPVTRAPAHAERAPAHPVAIENPLMSFGWACAVAAPKDACLPAAAAAAAAMTVRPPGPEPLQPAWRASGHDGVPPFERAAGEWLRRTHEFPVLVSDDAARTVWHYCSVMAQQGVLAGHFEVHGLSRADIGGRGEQHRIIVYSCDARPGVYQLAMDTHPDGPPEQPRIFLLHDAQANHYRFLATRDTTRPMDVLQRKDAQAVESGGAGDCLFFSVARGLGFGGHHQQAAKRLRRMATNWLYHHPDTSLNGDTIALFVSKL